MNAKEFKYGQIALLHNIVLDEVLKLKSFPEFSIEEVHYLSLKVINKHYNLCYNELLHIDYQDFKPFYDLIKSQMKYEDIIALLHKEGYLSAELKVLIDNFFKSFSIATNLKEFKNSIDEFIKLFSNNNKLNEIETIACWACASVADFSLLYWWKISEDPTSPWFNFFITKDENNKGEQQFKASGKRKKWWHVIAVVGADCLGAVAGAVTVGAVTGGAGAVEGAIAVGSSASTFVGDILKDKNEE